jgi:uncharacterized membrane-anchored protein
MIGVMAILKGIAMAAILIVIADLAFVQGLITAIASACVSGVFLLVATHLNNKQTVKKIQKVEESITKEEGKDNND